ncbi:MAG: xanthine dehydrogenase accessory protein XdhC [Gammaproteobacteria bacterium]|nr:xanthine dehydrogenase accessory protein XdhC [Gammaproteobacteria bacterium]
MASWLDELRELAAGGEDAVLVTVAGIRGSAPRETGATMVVTRTATFGSIGGGQLEYQATERAARLLREGTGGRALRRYALGANCGQCCGGVVDILFELLPVSSADWLDELHAHHDERRPAVLLTCIGDDSPRIVSTGGDAPPGLPADVSHAVAERADAALPARAIGDWLVEPIRRTAFDIAVFGAGHVGAAVVDILSRLDCEIRWVDSRRRMFPLTLPPNVTAIAAAEPAREAAALPPGAYCLIMTHSHPLDLEICAHVLTRHDVAYCGLIGSASKRRRFERLMRAQGLSPSQISRLVCPIGVPGISGKKPVEIALAVAAQVLQQREHLAPAIHRRPHLEVTG